MVLFLAARIHRCKDKGARRSADSKGFVDEAWRKVHGQLMALPPKRHATFDYTILEKWDGVMDTPMAELFPYILAAFPRAKVILSVR